MAVLARMQGSHAIGWDQQVKVAYIGVIGDKEDKDVPGQPRGDYGGHLEIAEEEIEGRGIKAGVLRLEHEIIVRLGR
jgi:hypothetical protein